MGASSSQLVHGLILDNKKRGVYKSLLRERQRERG